MRKQKEKLEAEQPKMSYFPQDIAPGPNDEFVELLWEDGQIVMQGQSSRTKKCLFSSCFSSDASKERGEGDTVGLRHGRSGCISSVNDVPSSAASAHLGLGQDDDMVPWLNYTSNDSLQSSDFEEFFSELTGTNFNATPGLTDGSCNSQVGKDANIASLQCNASQGNRNPSKISVGSSGYTRMKSCHTVSIQQDQTFISNFGPRFQDLPTNIDRDHQAMPRTLSQSPVSVTRMLDADIKTKSPAYIKPSESSRNKDSVNFSHFARPAAFIKANLQGINLASPSFSNPDRLNSNKVSTSGSNHIDPAGVASMCGSKNQVAVPKEQVLVPAEVETKSHGKPPRGLAAVEKREAIFKEHGVGKNGRLGGLPNQSSSFSVSGAIGRSESESAFEPVVASSSVCSGNSGGISNQPKHEIKRKAVELDSENLSEDVEGESMEVKKPTKSKRNRTAEVHNLSERRRRDRINEKMRSLQELIPNCNKVDKASMLDEAIEYIKNLQLQLQVMSMGARPCMPPLFLPAGTGTHHMGLPHMCPFPPPGTEMGMGLGVTFRMGMHDMNFPPNYPIIPLPPMYGAQFPCTSVPGALNFYGAHASSVPMFRVPGQGLPVAHPCTTFIPSGGSSSKECPVPSETGATNTLSTSGSSLLSISKDHSQNISIQKRQKTGTSCLQNQNSTEDIKECSDFGALVQNSSAASPVRGGGVIDTIRVNEIAAIETTDADNG